MTLSRPDGGVFSSIGLLIVGIFQLLFFVIGLAIGIAVCLAAFFLIFIAAAYLTNMQLGKETAKKIWIAVRAQTLAGLAAIAPQRFGELAHAAAYSSPSPSVAPVPAEVVVTATAPEEGPGQYTQAVQETAPATASDQVLTTLTQLEQRLADIETTMQSIEADSARFANTEQVDELRASMQELDNRSGAALEAQITPVQERLEQIAQQGEDLNVVSKKLGDIIQRIATLEQKAGELGELPQQIEQLRDEVPQQLAALQGKVEKQIASLQPKKSTPARSRSRKKTTAQ
ncbi:MAG: hypothetical protein ACOX4Z_05070 [Desulfobulbus sp.]